MSEPIRIDVQPVPDYNGPDSYRWVLQATGPVRDLAESVDHFRTRAEAIADFQEVADLLGWKTFVSVDWQPEP